MVILWEIYVTWLGHNVEHSMGKSCDILWEIYRPDYVTWFFQFDSIEMEN